MGLRDTLAWKRHIGSLVRRKARSLPAASNPLHRVQGLLQPASEVPLAGDRVEDTHPGVLRLHPEACVDEGSRPRGSEGQIHERPGVRAADSQLAEFIESVDHNVEFLVAERALGDLSVATSLLEPFALDVDNARPPLWMAVDVPDEGPDDLHGSIDQGLSTAIGHDLSGWFRSRGFLTPGKALRHAVFRGVAYQVVGALGQQEAGANPGLTRSCGVADRFGDRQQPARQLCVDRVRRPGSGRGGEHHGGFADGRVAGGENPGDTGVAVARR